jgi:predicted phosphodiesterase
MHADAIDFLADLRKEYKPDQIVHLGDEVDQHALSDWDHDPDGKSAGDEYDAAIRQMKLLYKLFPDVRVMESNHGRRPFRKAFRAGIPRVYLRAYTQFMESPEGWSWHENVTLDKVLYFHGDGFTGKDGALKAAISHRRSVVIGHIHTFAGVQYSAGSHDQIFGLNSGCLIDTTGYAFNYGKHHASKPVLGASVIIDGREAVFIPMKK